MKVGGAPNFPRSAFSTSVSNGREIISWWRKQYLSHNIGAKAPCGHRTYQDIGVKKDLHEISEKTSSSVRKPRASAKGMILFRKSSNC